MMSCAFLVALTCLAFPTLYTKHLMEKKESRIQLTVCSGINLQDLSIGGSFQSLLSQDVKSKGKHG